MIPGLRKLSAILECCECSKKRTVELHWDYRGDAVGWGQPVLAFIPEDPEGWQVVGSPGFLVCPDCAEEEKAAREVER